jgi:recombination protein RecT
VRCAARACRAVPSADRGEFKKNTTAWRKQIVDKKKTVAELIAFIETRALLTEEQKLTIDSWSHETE